MKDDATLLDGYARNNSEIDFAELVGRHVNLVYSAALRQLNGDAHLAQDVTQTVFTDLARKAAALRHHRVLAGWLFTSTRFAAAKLVRGEQRRRTREQEAQLMNELNATESTAVLDWARVRPVLDEALAEMNERDREAILLRYLEGRNFAEVGARLELSDHAARMRVDRAVDKLRALLVRRGVTSTSGALALALAGNAVAAAPAGLATSIASLALAGAGPTGAAAAATTFMSLTKLQVTIAATVIAAGSASYVVQEKQNAGLRGELDHLEPTRLEIGRLERANRELTQAVNAAHAAEISDAELTRLRDEAAAIQARLKANAQGSVAAAESTAAAIALNKTYAAAQLDQMPKLVGQTPIKFPANLMATKTGGQVLVSFAVDREGRVRNALAVESTNPQFEEATITALEQWRFAPGKKGGRDVNVRVMQRFDFTADPKGGSPVVTTPAEMKPALPDWF